MDSVPDLNVSRRTNVTSDTTEGYSASDTSTIPGLTPEVSRDLEDIVFSLSGDGGLTEARCEELTKRVTRWATGGGK